MTSKSILGLMCICVLVGILCLGLWPFRRPRNDAKWLENESGLRLSGYGTLFTSNSFQMADSEATASSTIEIWIQPGRTFDSSTLLTFSTPENPLQFSIHQYRSGMVLKRRSLAAKQAESTIGVEKIFESATPIFIAIASGTKATTIYANGRELRSFRGYRLGKEVTGRLVIGTSPVRTDGWLGTLKGLAIYDKELGAESISRHFTIWAKRSASELQTADGIMALYLFDERSGSLVHNRVNSGLDLQIPARFVLLHEPFLIPFWREFEFNWGYAQDLFINVIGFVPLGLVFYVYWIRARPIHFPAAATVVLGFVVSLTIEVLQSYLPTRNSGTTDLITNTLGTLVGVAICRTSAGQKLISRLL